MADFAEPSMDSAVGGGGRHPIRGSACRRCASSRRAAPRIAAARLRKGGSAQAKPRCGAQALLSGRCTAEPRPRRDLFRLLGPVLGWRALVALVRVAAVDGGFDGAPRLDRAISDAMAELDGAVPDAVAECDRAVLDLLPRITGRGCLGSRGCGERAAADEHGKSGDFDDETHASSLP